MNKIWRNYWYYHDLPTWEDYIIELDRSVENAEFIKQTDNFGFVLHNGNNIPKLAVMQDHIWKTFAPEEPVCTTHLYISLVSSSETFGRHKDTTDVYFICGEGSVNWKVEYEDETIETILNKGDMIYLPKDRYHTPTPLTPRVGISIGFEQ